MSWRRAAPRRRSRTTTTWAVAVSAAPSSVTEGDTGSVALTARIVRGDGSVPEPGECLAPFAVDVGLAVEGTATGAGTDYTLTGATAAREIAACSTGTVSWTVEIAAVVDAKDDGGETVVFAPVLDGTPAVAPAEHTVGTVVLRELRSVSIDLIALGVDEGGSAVYTVRLTSRPMTGTVTVTPQVTGDMDVTVTPSVLTFSGANWNLPQTLTVHAAQDADDEDETVSVSHLVSGPDYAGVQAAGVRVAVEDDDKSFGVMTVRLSDGAEGADTRAPAPAAHDGEVFHVTLWWSGNVVRTDDFAYPQRAIGPDRAIRVTGATVRPAIERAVGKWTQSRLRLELTPEDAATDVELVLEPLDCSYPDLARPDPNPDGLCAWRRGGGGITGLAQRVRWTVTGLGHVPGAPRNLTVEEDEIVTSDGSTTDVRRVLVAAFDADPYGAEWHVEAQAAGGDWSDPEVRSGAKRGSLHRVRLDGLDPDGAWTCGRAGPTGPARVRGRRPGRRTARRWRRRAVSGSRRAATGARWRCPGRRSRRRRATSTGCRCRWPRATGRTSRTAVRGRRTGARSRSAAWSVRGRPGCGCARWTVRAGPGRPRPRRGRRSGAGGRGGARPGDLGSRRGRALHRGRPDRGRGADEAAR